VSEAVLALRLAAPLQSWGGRSSFNRRDTRSEPTKSGILGLLAAASGIRREEPINDLLGLRLGVRTDQPGSLLRDYHVASDYRGGGLPTADVNSKGLQKTNPKKTTYVTERFYLQDAIFVAAIAGPTQTIAILKDALLSPQFPLSLGRRSCPPAGRLLLGTYPAGLDEVLHALPWQASAQHQRRHGTTTAVRLPATIEDEDGDDSAWDVPSSFSLRTRTFSARRVRHTWITPLPEPKTADGHPESAHDPFDLLGA
jgi:CRISPR system Cascade subunit CasD